MVCRDPRFAARVLALPLLELLLTCACGVVAAPQLLDTVWERRTRLLQKTMDRLASEGVCQTERLIFHEVETGAEVWRLTFDAGVNSLHSHINRSPWNCDGSVLVFQSNRGMPGLWKREETGRGDLHFFALAPDGASFRLLRPVAPEGQWGRPLGGRHVVWDRFDPKRTYWVTHVALYAVDLLRKELEVTKLLDLPHPERRKSIFSYPSENNVLMLQDLNSRDYAGELYFVDLKKRPGEDGFFFHYPRRFNVEHPKHDPATEFGFHDVYFRRTPDDSYVFNFGSAGSAGEALFFEAPLRFDRGKIRVCYPDKENGVPYYSHPAWSHDGRLVSYFGCEDDRGEVNPGWHVRDHDAKADVARLVDGWVGGHAAWDGYDSDWVFAALSSQRFVPEWHGWIAHAHLPDGKAKKLVRHHTRENGGKSNYAALARPAQSPDGTKCLYHSTMLHTDDETMDLYLAVSHRPAPPTELRAAVDAQRPNVVKLSWRPPKMHREVKGYRVYRSDRPAGEFAEISKELVAGAEFGDVGARSGKTYHYFVTSEEYSGLESERGSPVLKIGVGTADTETLPPVEGWDQQSPEPPGNLRCEWTEDGMTRLTWSPSKSSDVRYYNLYYSTEKPPEPVQANRLVSPGKADATYLDWGINPSAKRHFYAMTAVDRQGNESEAALGSCTR